MSHLPSRTIGRRGARQSHQIRRSAGWRILQPVLFVNGDLDQINTINGNRLGDPMRAACADLTVTSLPGAHWLPVECKAELIQSIRSWLETKSLRERLATP